MRFTEVLLYETWPDAEFVQQAAAQLPRFHLCTLIDKLKTREERDWYLAKVVEYLLADRNNAPALAFYARLGFEESAMVVRRLGF